MSASPPLIMIQFLQWVADRPRCREDVMEAWRSSCPRFPVWEDARADGLVSQVGGAEGQHRVELTERGRAMIVQASLEPLQAVAKRRQAGAKRQQIDRARLS